VWVLLFVSKKLKETCNMCLIAYVPAGKALKRDVFDHAHSVNRDGIGVMSNQGVEKFFGHKALKRAREYVATLAELGIEHAVHWRYATHGAKRKALCHPFKLPNANAYLMHNGVIGKCAKDSTDEASDTLLYVNSLTDAPETGETLGYWNDVCDDIGDYNKCIVMYPDRFIFLHKDKFIEIDGILYSNAYSLPYAMRPNSYFTPSRLAPTSYYETGSRSNRYAGPFGSSIYWSEQKQAYGFWQGNRFTALAVSVLLESDKQEPTRPVTIPPKQETLPVGSDIPKCPRCSRPTIKTGWSVTCWCDPLELAQWHSHNRPVSSGPSLGEEGDEVTAVANAHIGPCEHGEPSWEECRECINRLQDDETPKSNIIYLPHASAK
jgi:hypothetical protein